MDYPKTIKLCHERIRMLSETNRAQAENIGRLKSEYQKYRTDLMISQAEHIDFQKCKKELETLKSILRMISRED